MTNDTLLDQKSDSLTTAISLPVLSFTFVLAFCSIVYELLLGQTLSAFLGNTVLRYSVTIGLYMFSMGVGALIAGPRVLKTPVLSLQWIELILAVIGGVCVPLLFFIDYMTSSTLILSVIAHSLIIIIGVLTGLEIPLLVEIQAKAENSTSRILGVDYIGAFVGTVAFALWFYPQLGIFATAFFTATLNAAVGILLPLYLRDQTSVSKPLVYAQTAVLIALIMMLSNYAAIEEFGIEIYLR